MAPRNTRSKAVSTPVSYIPALHTTRTEDESHSLLILPRHASPEARVVSLLCPSNSRTSRYFFCPRLGLYEMTKVGSPRTSPRSCLIAKRAATTAKIPEDISQPSIKSRPVTSTDDGIADLENGYVLENSNILVATPFDIVFLLLPLFSSGPCMYRPADDHFDELLAISTGLESLLRYDTFRHKLASRLATISAKQDIGGGEVVYKPDVSLLLAALVQKVERAARRGFPASMEEGLVQKPLDIPLQPFVKISGDAAETPTAESGTATTDSKQDQSDSEPANTSNTLNTSTFPRITQLMRQRATFDFLLAAYVPAKLRPQLEELFKTSKGEEFAPLEKHMERVKKAKVEAQALRSLSDNISRKRSALEDDEAAEARAEKKRKKEEEEKRKKAETRATKDLKKVDTTGMKKLSSFFYKPPAAKA